MNGLYEFGPYRLDPACRKVWRDQEDIPFTGKQFDVLYAIVKREGSIAETDTILEEVWPNDQSDLTSKRGRLARHVSDLRRNLNPKEGNLNYLKQASGRGYFISVPVKVILPGQVAGPVLFPAFSTKWWLWFASAVFFTLFAAVGYFRIRGEGLSAIRYRALTDDGRAKTGPLLSDGHRIVFREQVEGEWRVASVPISGGEVSFLNIPLRDGLLCDIAADGSALLLSTREGASTKLWSWPLTDGSPREIPQGRDNAAWAPDRNAIAFGGTSLTVARSGGGRTVFSDSQFAEVSNPRWSPDGARISFTLTEPKSWTSSLWQSDSNGRHWERMPKTVDSGENQANGTWTPDGRYFVYEAGSSRKRDLWVIPGANRSIDSYFGKALRLTDGPLNWIWPVPARMGACIFAVGESSRGELQRMDPRTGVWSPYLGGLAAYELDFSRDGKWIAYTRYPEHTIWKVHPDGSAGVQLTGTEFEAHQPHWSPDGARIAFMAHKPGKAWRVMTLDVSSGSVKEPIPNEDDQGVPTWSKDGHSLVFGDRLFVKDRSAMIIRFLDERSHEVSMVPGSANLWTPRWSPDGTYISALRPDGTALLLSQCCFSEWKTILSGAEALDDPMWSRDSRYIFMMAGNGPGHRKLQRLTIPEGSIERIADISAFPSPGEQWFGIAPDGSALGLRGAYFQEIYAIDYKLR